MLTLAFWATLALQPQPAMDTVAVYAAVLQEIRAEYPGRSVVLSETRSDVECMPRCSGTVWSEDGKEPVTWEEHAAELVQQLKHRGLVDATCRTRESVLGCRDYSGHLFVALGTIQGDTPQPGTGEDAGVWILAVTHAGCSTPMGEKGCRFFDAMGIRYLVKKDEAGVWKVVRRRPKWMT